MKKILVVVLLVCFVLSISSFAFAAESTEQTVGDYTVTIPMTLNVGDVKDMAFSTPDTWVDGEEIYRLPFQVELLGSNIADDQFIEIKTDKVVTLNSEDGDSFSVNVYPYERAYTEDGTKEGAVTITKNETDGKSGVFCGTTIFKISPVNYDKTSEIQRSIGAWSFEGKEIPWDESGKTFAEIYPEGIQTQDDAIAMLNKVKEFGYTGISSIRGYEGENNDARFSASNLKQAGIGMGEVYSNPPMNEDLTWKAYTSTDANAVTCAGETMSGIEYIKKIDDYMTESGSEGVIALECLVTPVFVTVAQGDDGRSYDGHALQEIQADMDVYAEVFEARIDRIVDFVASLNESGGIKHYLTLEVEPGSAVDPAGTAFESPLEVAVMMDRVNKELAEKNPDYENYVQLALDLGHLARCECSEAGESNTTEQMGFDYFKTMGYIPEGAEYINGFYSEFREGADAESQDPGVFSIEKYMSYPGVTGNIKEIQFWDWDGGNDNIHLGFGAGKIDYMEWMKALVNEGAFDGENITAEFLGYDYTDEILRDGGMFTEEWMLLYFVDRD